ncbi:MAG: DUF4173 domain-containing protein [Eubacteriales bacterium]
MEYKLNNIQSEETDKKPIFGNESLDYWAVVISIVIGAAFSLLVIKDYIGINLFIFSLLTIAGVGYTLHKDNNLDFKNYAYFAGAFLIYASVFFRLNQEIYIALVFPILISLLVITTIFSAKKGSKSGIATFIYRLFGPIGRVDKIFLGLSRFKKSNTKMDQKYKQVLYGVLISIALLFIVIPLMISAEAAFKAFLENIFKNIHLNFDVAAFMWKTIAGTLIAMVFCGFLYTFTKDKMMGLVKEKNKSSKNDNTSIIITVLSIMGFVFMVFAIVQFSSLFITKEAIVANTTFAKTAREGYFQLVVLSIINFIMVLISIGTQNGENKKSRNVIKILTTYFTILNVYLLISSAYKMTLYYSAYGLSVERLLVYILLVFEMIALVFLMIKIYKNNLKFIKIMIYITVGFWAAVSLINIDAWVMKTNINRYYETGKIDIAYINDLSADASKQIKQFYFDNYENFDDEMKQEIDRYYFGYFNYRRNVMEINILDYDMYDIDDYKTITKFDSFLEYNSSKVQKINDGLDILQYYDEIGYVNEEYEKERPN